MGKTTGFLEFEREIPVKVPVQERLKTYHEFVGRFSETELNHQAARCMNCGVPFCHSHSGCPLGNVIPEFNDAVYRKSWKEAYDILSTTNNFPEFTGRICPAPCESACVLGINNPPVTIEEIEKHIIEIAFEKGFVQPKKINMRSGKRVAVIGSGPSGLAAAAQLNYAGHAVTVFERDDVPGGLLRYGIPDFKLEKWVIDRRLNILEKEGIEFKCNANVGVNVPVKEILNNYDAVVVAGGSTVPRDLPVPGRDAKGVHFAMEFLKQQNKFNAEKNPFANSDIESNIYPEIINAFNKDVVVIGGGDTGSDCIGTSKRQGARSVLQIELLPQPPKSRTHHMPWPTYPMLLKITSSHEEGCDREWAIATKEFLKDDEGNLKALKVINLEWQLGDDGRASGFKEVAGTEREIPCQLVLLAMGFVHPQHKGMLEDLKIELDERRNVKADNKSYQTNHKKVFAAGDMRRGQSLVVWAINEGRQCAESVDAFLSV
ncbi:glutamate synthase subunit beta [Parafilimonas sp.]|uniref:glutamate synthase subunit beta n=1 Tax=Parafilimonas sp. TaxID=1969739 RepID=UPI0039E5B932